MAYTVLQSFRDIHTRVVHIAGSEYPENSPAERVKKLTDLGYISTEVGDDDIPDETGKDNKTVAEIKEVLAAKNIEYPAKATKIELLALLEA